MQTNISTVRTASTSEADPRVLAFAAFCKAVDQSDWRAGQNATRELRGMGISVVLTPSSGTFKG